jgi:uncharacterized protein (DUF2141 family)
MKFKRIIKSIFKLLWVALVVTNCANPVPPTGGPRDEEAPKVLRFFPENKSTNLKSPSVEIHFNEFIQFRQSAGNVVITPPMDPEPEIYSKGKKITIDFNQKLLDNTTYTFNFGNSVKDFTEGNEMNELVYIFSTGDFLDSLSIKGNVIHAFDLSPVEGVSVLLYEELKDSILIKAKPFYISKTNAQGSFSFENLKSGRYKIAALEDQNLNFIFDQVSENVAFTNQIIDLQQEDINLSKSLVLFKDEEKVSIKEIKNRAPGKVNIALSKPIEDILIDASVYSESDIAYLNSTNDTLSYWYLNHSDTAIFYTTINQQPTDTNIISLKEVNKDENLNLVKISNQVPENQSINIKFSSPIVSIDTSLISIINQDSLAVPFVTAIEDYLTVSISSNWEEEQIFDLFIEEGAIEDYAGKTNQPIKDVVMIQEAVLPPNLILSFKNVGNGDYFIQLLNSNKKQLQSNYLNNKDEVIFNNLKAGKYFIRVFEDVNFNGTWDSGNFSDKKQPEPTLFFSNEIEMRNNWDQDLTIDLKE